MRSNVATEARRPDRDGDTRFFESHPLVSTALLTSATEVAIEFASGISLLNSQHLNKLSIDVPAVKFIYRHPTG